MEKFANVLAWALEYAKHEDRILVIDDGADSGRLKFLIATSRNNYFINALEDTQGMGENKSYLGCVASSRWSRAGEDWQRGNDLPDGPLSRETWDNIVAAILSYELVPIDGETRKARASLDAERVEAYINGQD